MQRLTILVLAGLLVLAVGYIAIQSRPPAPVTAVPIASVAPSALPAPPPPVERPNDGGDSIMPESAPADEAKRPAVPLPEGAPKEVGFGVVLFAYAGAELAPKTARPKAQALELARQAMPLARDDFDEAVKRGDPGSTRDAGHMPRGVLEPHVEYALFTLEKNAVHGEPLDTPRGYWIVRRNP